MGLVLSFDVIDMIIENVKTVALRRFAWYRFVRLRRSMVVSAISWNEKCTQYQPSDSDRCLCLYFCSERCSGKRCYAIRETTQPLHCRGTAAFSGIPTVCTAASTLHQWGKLFRFGAQSASAGRARKKDDIRSDGVYLYLTVKTQKIRNKKASCWPLSE